MSGAGDRDLLEREIRAALGRTGRDFGDAEIGRVVSAIVESAPMFVDKIGVPNLTSAEQRRELKRLLAAIERSRRTAAGLHPRVVAVVEASCPIRLLLGTMRESIAARLDVIPDGKPEKLTLQRIGKFTCGLLYGLGVKVTRTDQRADAYYKKRVQSPAVHVMRAALAYYGLPAPAHLRPYLQH